MHYVTFAFYHLKSCNCLGKEAAGFAQYLGEMLQRYVKILYPTKEGSLTLLDLEYGFFKHPLHYTPSFTKLIPSPLCPRITTVLCSPNSIVSLSNYTTLTAPVFLNVTRSRILFKRKETKIFTKFLYTCQLNFS